MVVPTRSQNSSWHSLWDLRGTQAPQLRQSNNTLGGRVNKSHTVGMVQKPNSDHTITYIHLEDETE